MTPTLQQAVAVLAAREHCGTADWGVAFNGAGPHAFGAHRNERGQYTGINLSAEDAVRVASKLLGEG